MSKADQVVENMKEADPESGSAIDTASIISDLRTKKDQEILEAVLNEVEKDDDIESRRPQNLSELHTKSYDLDKDDLAFSYKIDQGSREFYNVIFIRIMNMLSKGLSPNIGIFGKSQRGKSETALHILQTLHNDLNVLQGKFIPKNQVLYGVVPFLLFYRYNQRVGALFEEAGETLNKNDYNSKMNRAVRGVLRTQGKKQMVNIFVTPNYDALDPDVREEIDIEIEMTSTGKGEITLYEKVHGRRQENMTRKYKFASFDHEWKVPRPPSDLRTQYDNIDSGFKGRYLDDLLIDVIEERIEKEKQDRLMEF